MSQKVTFGEILPEFPKRVRKRTHWDEVVDKCRNTDGWVHVYIPSMSDDAHSGAPSHIKAGRFAAFREGKWDAAYRDGRLWVKYLGESNSTVVGIKSA